MKAKVIIASSVLSAAAVGIGLLGWLWFGAEDRLLEPWNMPIRCDKSEGGDSAVLPQSRAVALYSSRCNLGKVVGVSSRSIAENEIIQLDSKIKAFWASQTEEPRAKPLDHYVRQYAGVMVDGRKEICVNLVSRKFVKEDSYYCEHDRTMRALLPKGACPEDVWRHKPIVDVADGGADFCGVTFDVIAEKFNGVDCNGM